MILKNMNQTDRPFLVTMSKKKNHVLEQGFFFSFFFLKFSFTKQLNFLHSYVKFI